MSYGISRRTASFESRRANGRPNLRRIRDRDPTALLRDVRSTDSSAILSTGASGHACRARRPVAGCPGLLRVGQARMATSREEARQGYPRADDVRESPRCAGHRREIAAGKDSARSNGEIAATRVRASRPLPACWDPTGIEPCFRVKGDVQTLDDGAGKRETVGEPRKGSSARGVSVHSAGCAVNHRA